MNIDRSAEHSLFTLVLYMDRFVLMRRKFSSIHVYVHFQSFICLFSEEPSKIRDPKNRAPAVAPLTTESVQTVIDP